MPTVQAPAQPKAVAKVADLLGIKPSQTPPVQRRPLKAASSSQSRREGDEKALSSPKKSRFGDTSPSVGVLGSHDLNTEDGKGSRNLTSRTNSGISFSTSGSSSQASFKDKEKEKAKTKEKEKEKDKGKGKSKRKSSGDSDDEDWGTGNKKKAAKVDDKSKKKKPQKRRERYESDRSEDDAEDSEGHYDSEDERRANMFSAGSMVNTALGAGRAANLE